MPDPAARPLVPPTGWLGAAVEERSPLGFRYLAAVTALGALLRGLWLTRQSLWVDEIMTWQALRPGAGLDFLTQVRDAIQGPLYLAVVWPLVRLGDPELMLRLPAAVAGAATVPLFGLVAGRLLERPAARLATLLVALNPFLVWYSQEARGYAFVVLFGTAMVLAFLRLQERGPNLADGAGFALASAAAVWSNVSGLFLWTALGLTVVVSVPRGARLWAGWAAAFGAGLVLAAPPLLQAMGIWAVDRIVPGAATGEALRGATTFDPLAVPYALFTFFYGYSYGPSLRELHEPDRLAVVRAAWPWLAAGAVPLVAGGVAALARRDRRAWRLALWAAVPAAALLVLSLRNVKPWNVRYLAVAAPWVVALVASGLVRLPRRLGLALVGLLCAGTLLSLGAYYGDARYAKEDLRGAAAWVAAAEVDADPLPTFVPAVTQVWTFYSRSPGAVVGTFGEPALADAAAADALVARKLAGVDAAWVVLARTWALDPRGLLEPALRRAGAVTPAAGFAGVRVLAWRRTAAGEAGRGD